MYVYPKVCTHIHASNLFYANTHKYVYTYMFDLVILCIFLFVIYEYVCTSYITLLHSSIHTQQYYISLHESKGLPQNIRVCSSRTTLRVHMYRQADSISRQPTQSRILAELVKRNISVCGVYVCMCVCRTCMYVYVSYFC
jgi:hypothetical protein